MSLLNQITTGTSRSGIRMLIAGQEKMGKTTLGSMAPAPLLIPLEVGFAGVAVPKVPMVQSYTDLIALVDDITAQAQAGTFPFRTLVFDSATALERQMHDYVIALDPASKNGTSKTVTMESCHGGYGKGYNMANAFLDKLLKKLDILAVYGGINILLTCHVFSSKVLDPTSGEYDSWDLLLHSPKNQKTYGKREMLAQWADLIGFIYEPMFVTTSEGKNGGSGMAKGVSQNKGRVLGVSRTPAYMAGNRFGMMGEIPIPAPPANGWNYFADALFKTCGLDLYTR